ncbi:two-component sensor histidine kinase [Halomonas urumqiensis]|uniref:histidine kinase n=1 Tax=Halomonas urumqiensis TaxID=1684789 RepID=A0A2N7UH02_9GAMM|nr:two-component sensor histidine kinase [Halomonas urumqiensis]PTB04263.1 sensor histidine kinase [Halomonas urumqiensis]
MLAFAVFLTFALTRLFQVEQEMRSNVSENMLWVVTQAQVASHRLDEAVHRRVLGDSDVQPTLRFDVLVSRLTLLDEGPQRRYMEALGFGGELSMAFQRLEAIEARLGDVEPGATDAADDIHAESEPLLRELNRIANAVMVEEWESTGARLDKHRDSLVQAIASVMGITLSGCLLAILLLASLRDRLETQRLERSLEQEKQASDFYRSFAAMVSHQFRTPLAIIDSGLQRLLRRGETMTQEQRHTRYQRMREAIAQMTRLLESSLATARLDGGKVEARPEACDLVALTKVACHLQEEASAQRRIEVHASAPSILAWCDRSLVEQVLANLLSNAIKYSPPDTEITVGLDVDGQGRVVCSVADRGMGIPADELPRLFERYFRSRHVTNTSGIGLGLNIARHLSRLQHGDLEVRSQHGEGTTFTLTLPGMRGRHEHVDHQATN